MIHSSVLASVEEAFVVVAAFEEASVAAFVEPFVAEPFVEVLLLGEAFFFEVLFHQLVLPLVIK
jgi:hypothetical protein